MCGIYGRINKKSEINKDGFLSSLDTLKSRGPDNLGTYFENNLGLGFRRLSIIDLSEKGNQPMFDSSGDVGIVFNGEIYNFNELKDELGSEFEWKSHSDTEVLLNGYKKWGLDELLQKIEGMFGFAIYDKQKKVISFARDHFGKKPLYYYFDEDTFIFASELKAIISDPEIKKRCHVDKLSLSKYLFYGYVPSPNSIFDKIKKLEPSSSFVFDIEKWEISDKKRFWNLENVELRDVMSEQDMLDKTEDLIKKSIEKRLISDVPLGVFLSGGVDSSLVASYMSQISDDVNSFTVCYKDYPKDDESDYAKRVAQKLGIKSNLCYFENKLVKENFIEILDYLDEPLADAAIIPLYFVSKFAKKNITVSLSGDGGDEVFGGYSKYKAQDFIEKFSYLKFISGLGKKLFKNDSSYFKLLSSFDESFYSRQFIFGSGSFFADEVTNLVKDCSFSTDEIFSEAKEYDLLFKQQDNINRSLYLDCKIQLPDWYLVKGDRATMANSLEMRNPLLDKDLAEFAFSLEGSWKIRNGEQKYLLKKLASKYVDRDIIYREKSGFGVPLGDWIRTELKDLFDEFLFIDNGFFDLDYVRKLYDEHLEGKAENEFKLLRIFGFNYWYKKYYEF